MKLRNIIENIDIIDIRGDTNLDIKNIYYDSRKVTKDSLLICIRGYKNDGHKFIDTAIENGAVAILIEEDIEKYIAYENITFIKTNDTRASMAKVSCNFYDNPTMQLKIIGVTGTNGKTSITTFIKQILSQYGKVGLVGTINIDNGKEEIVSKNTTPESLDLQHHLSSMVKNNCRYCVMEVSSHSLALNRVDEIKFDIGIFTNLTPDHLDFHKDLEDYRNTKEHLFYKTDRANIINIDDEGGQKIFNNISKLETPIYTYSIENKADFMAKDIELKSTGVHYKVITPTYEDSIYVPIPGKFTIYNTLAVIATNYILNIPIEITKVGLENTKGVAGRFDNIKNDKGITVIVDYAHTPDALENVLTTAKEFAKGKIITVFGCGGDRDKGKRPVMGKLAQQYSDISIVTNDNPRSENPDLIIEDIVKGMDIDKEYVVIKDRKDAINYAIDKAFNGDVVMIVGKGHENYQIIGDVKHHFDDKEVAKEAINRKSK
ncbi:MAG: UDP-N-acetylmuramoyl-L-alanyl-D-glutamate--2,6-diaminopimelate ligase [Romboutsia sp.]